MNLLLSLKVAKLGVHIFINGSLRIFTGFLIAVCLKVVFVAIAFFSQSNQVVEVVVYQVNQVFWFILHTKSHI